jgi:hypothetical protein
MPTWKPFRLWKKNLATLLSFSCHDIAPAVIDDDALSKISELEKKLGVVLVAVQ